VSKDRFEQLWQDYLEGDLDAAGIDELDALLKANPELKLQAADEYELHRQLGLIHQAKDPALFATSTLARIATDRQDFADAVQRRLPTTNRPSSRRSQLLGFFLVSAATLIFTLAIQALFFTRPEALQTPPASDPIATLVLADHARWEPDLSMAEGHRLKPGPLRLAAGGSAFILFDSGALAALQGPVECDLETRGSLRLKLGRVSVRAEGDASGFTVQLPSGEARDLGTEFLASADPSGATEVHVLEGEVAWATGAELPPSRFLRAGQAIRFESRQAPEGRSIPLAAQPIKEQLRLANQSSPRPAPTAGEPFAYDVGEVSLDRASGGFGWAGPWRLRRGGEVTREGDTNKILSIVQPGRLRLPPGNTVRVRSLSDPIDLSKNSVTYISFSVRRELQPSEESPGSPHFRLTLRSSIDFWGKSVGIGYPPTGKPTIQIGMSESYAAPVAIDPGAIQLWVVKIVSSHRGPDQVFLKVFRPGEGIPDLEPAPWTVVTSAFQSDARLDLVLVTGSGPAIHELENLRLGPTWDSVVRRD
jgi:hypothetical protein